MGVFSSAVPSHRSAPASRSTRSSSRSRARRQFTRPRLAPTSPPLSLPGPSPLPYTAVRSITSAARSINLSSHEEVSRLARRRGGDEWQAESWEYFDAVGEIKYALTLVANVLSRIRLYAAEIKDPTQAPSPADPDSAAGGAASAALTRLDSAYGGQPGLLRDAALNLQVTGECYLVQQPGSPHLGVAESWDVRSVDELLVDSSGKAYLQTRRDMEASARRPLPKSAFVARIWRPHPRYSDEPDSSMRGILDLCSELLLLNRTFRSTARSRLNAGMLYLPDGLSVAAAPDAADDEADLDEDDSGTPGVSPITAGVGEATDEEDDFEEALLEAMTTPISDEESASAVVPLLVRGPAELGEKIKQFKFERSFDAHLVQRSDRVLDRIMQGLDVPKDVVSGLSNVKYANAVVIEDSLYRSHVEPLIVLLCDALTVSYLRPALRAAGVDQSEIDRFVFWYDPSGVTFHPNRSDDANEGYDRNALSSSAWRRAHGFTDEDAPTPNEVVIRMLQEKGPLTPELTEALISVIAPEVMERVRQASQAANPAPLPPDVAEALGAPAPNASPPASETPGEGGVPSADGEDTGPDARPSASPPPSPGTPSAPGAPPLNPRPPQEIREEDLV